MLYTTLFIDLDDTIYPYQTGVWPLIKDRISLYMHERMNMDWNAIPEIRRKLFEEYGTTLRGLVSLYKIDQEEYLDFVHDIPLQNYLSINPVLYKVLESYTQRRLIFTNSDHKHARRVLGCLGVEDLFERIIDIHDIDPYCKPMPQAFAAALRCSGEPDPSKCVFVDDSPVNLATAKALGFFTIRVGSTESSANYHAAIDTIHDLPTVLPCNGHTYQ